MSRRPNRKARRADLQINDKASYLRFNARWLGGKYPGAPRYLAALKCVREFPNDRGSP